MISHVSVVFYFILKKKKHLITAYICYEFRKYKNLVQNFEFLLNFL